MVPLIGIRRAVISRFAPAIGMLLGSTLTAIAFAEPRDFHWAAAGIGVLEAFAMSAGYGLGLLWLRRRLPEDAPLNGWRSSVAGLLAIAALGLLSVFTQGATTATIAVLSVAAGAVSAALIWIPSVLRPRRRKRTLDELEAEVDAKLAELEGGRELFSPRAQEAEPDKERFKFWRRVA